MDSRPGLRGVPSYGGPGHGVRSRFEQGGALIWCWYKVKHWRHIAVCIHNMLRSRLLFIVSILMKTILSRGTSVSRGIISVTWINFISSLLYNSSTHIISHMIQVTWSKSHDPSHMIRLKWIFEWTFHVKKIIRLYIQRNFVSFSSWRCFGFVKSPKIWISRIFFEFY